MNSVSFVSAPFSGGQPKAGAELGPAAIFAAGLEAQLGSMGVHYRRCADEVVTNAPAVSNISGSGSVGEVKRALWVGHTCKALSDVVYREASAGRIPITLGGDHSIAVGTLQGILRAHPSSVVFWIDAHADINTPVTSPSGNAHGMPLAFLLGLINASTIPGFEWVQPLLSPSRLVYIGLRDLDEGEKKNYPVSWHTRVHHA